jgi:hypothetical protein
MNNNLEIFEQGWPGNDTVCGWGSTIENTVNIRHSLPKLIKKYNIKSINDVGCGDLFWIKTIDLTDIQYHGYDIYRRSTWNDLILKGWRLDIADITKDILPSVDLTICRDVFIHLPNNMVLNALDNIRSNSKYLLTTNFLKDEDGNEIDNFSRRTNTGISHSKLNLIDKPFNLGKPILIIPEEYPFKSTSLWKL